MEQVNPAQGDVILCVLAHEAHALRAAYPGVRLTSPYSIRGFDGIQVSGRIFVTDLAAVHPQAERAVQALQRYTRKSGGDPAVRSI